MLRLGVKIIIKIRWRCFINMKGSEVWIVCLKEKFGSGRFVARRVQRCSPAPPPPPPPSLIKKNKNQKNRNCKLLLSYITGKLAWHFWHLTVTETM